MENVLAHFRGYGVGVVRANGPFHTSLGNAQGHTVVPCLPPCRFVRHLPPIPMGLKNIQFGSSNKNSSFEPVKNSSFEPSPAAACCGLIALNPMA